MNQCNFHLSKLAIKNWKLFFVIAFNLFLITDLNAQKLKADSVASLLQFQNTDTDRVINMWNTATYLYSYAPDSSIRIAQKALQLAEQIKYTDGISRSLGKIANGFLSLGNYPQALDYYLKKLKIEENNNKPYNLASVTMNIGIVYVYREEYQKALYYFKLADSIISKNKFIDLQFNINLNLGDVYFKKKMLESSFFYFHKSLNVARELKDGNFIGIALTGLGHVNAEAGNFKNALIIYKEGITYLQKSNNEEVVCEALLGLGKLYYSNKKFDSCIYFSKKSLLLARKDGFQSREIEAAIILKDAYSNISKMDSAYFYLQQVQVMGDSLNSKKNIRASEILSMNEELRQNEIVQNNLKLKEERHKQLQLLLIGLGIPLFFLVTLLLSRIKVHARVIRFLGVISLLILFEYITILVHPQVEAITHHTPFYEMLIFVSIASLLIPAHHRIEHWLLEKLTIKKGHTIRIKTNRIKVKKIV